MKPILFIIMIAVLQFANAQQNWQVIKYEDSIFSNSYQDSIDEIAVQLYFLQDSLLYDSLNALIVNADSTSGSSTNSFNFLKTSRDRCDNDARAKTADGMYALVKKHKENHPTLDFAHKDWNFVPVFQQYFSNNDFHDFLWNNARIKEHFFDDESATPWWNSVPTYINGWGYYNQGDCEVFETNEFPENYYVNSQHLRRDYILEHYKYINIYNQALLDLPKVKRDELVAERKNTKQFFMTKNTVLENGYLKLKTISEDLGVVSWFADQKEEKVIDKYATNTNVSTYTVGTSGNLTEHQYTSSGFLETWRYFKEGMMLQAKIRVPNDDGLWPAFWMMGGSEYERENFKCDGNNPYQEFDIFEFMDNDEDKMKITMHGPRDIGQMNIEKYCENNFFNQFHIYTIYWTECGIKIYLDEGSDRKCIYEMKKYPGTQGGDCYIPADKTYYENLRYPIHPMRIIFNVAAYACEDLRAKTPLNTSMDIEWVKVFYQRPCIDELVIEDMSIFEDIDYQMFNVEIAKTIKIRPQSSYDFVNKRPFNKLGAPYFKFMHQDGFILEPGSQFGFNSTVYVEDEIAANVCFDYGAPIKNQDDELNGSNTNNKDLNGRNLKQSVIKEANNDIKLAEKMVFNLFPNPANNELILEIESSKLLHFEYVLYDFQGKVINQQNVNIGINKIDISALSSGSYLIQLKKGIEIVENKLIVIQHD